MEQQTPRRCHEAMRISSSVASFSSSAYFLKASYSHYFRKQFRASLATNKISDQSTMEKHSQGNQIDEVCSKEACDFKSRKNNSDAIIPHILHLYGSCATPQDFEIYKHNASFEDPLMCANGVKQIKSAFYSLSKVFSESRIVEYNIKENVISPGKQEILIDNKQHYKFLGKEIDIISLIKLYVVDGKVVRHEDWWDKKPLWNRETSKLPLVGRIAEVTRKGSMLATHAIMRFGKDPTN